MSDVFRYGTAIALGYTGRGGNSAYYNGYLYAASVQGIAANPKVMVHRIPFDSGDLVRLDSSHEMGCTNIAGDLYYYNGGWANAVSVVIIGNILHILVAKMEQYYYGSTQMWQAEYFQFDLSTELWTTVHEVLDNYQYCKSASDPYNNWWGTIWKDGSNRPVIVTPLPEVRTSGTWYWKYGYRVRTGANTWVATTGPGQSSGVHGQFYSFYESADGTKVYITAKVGASYVVNVLNLSSLGWGTNETPVSKMYDLTYYYGKFKLKTQGTEGWCASKAQMSGSTTSLAHIKRNSSGVWSQQLTDLSTLSTFPGYVFGGGGGSYAAEYIDNDTILCFLPIYKSSGPYYGVVVYAYTISTNTWSASLDYEIDIAQSVWVSVVPLMGCTEYWRDLGSGSWAAHGAGGAGVTNFKRFGFYYVPAGGTHSVTGTLVAGKATFSASIVVSRPIKITGLDLEYDVSAIEEFIQGLGIFYAWFSIEGKPDTQVPLISFSVSLFGGAVLEGGQEGSIRVSCVAPPVWEEIVSGFVGGYVAIYQKVMYDGEAYLVELGKAGGLVAYLADNGVAISAFSSVLWAYPGEDYPAVTFGDGALVYKSGGQIRARIRPTLRPKHTIMFDEVEKTVKGVTFYAGKTSGLMDVTVY
jgi:hypothetical protein